MMRDDAIIQGGRQTRGRQGRALRMKDDSRKVEVWRREKETSRENLYLHLEDLATRLRLLATCHLLALPQLACDA